MHKYFSKTNFLIALIFLLILFALLIWYIVVNWSSFENIGLIQPTVLILVILLIIVNIYSMGKTLELAVEPHGIFLSEYEIFGLANLSRFANNTLPAGIGASVRAIYLKSKFQLPLSKFTSSMAVSLVLQFIVTGFIAIIILSWHFASLSIPNLGTILLLSVLLLVVIYFFPIKFLINKEFKSKHTILKSLYLIAEQYVLIRKSPQLFIRSSIWILITVLVAAMSIKLLYESLGYSIELNKATFIISMSVWGMLLSITPGNLGIREGLMTFAAGLLGVSIPETIIVAIVYRLLTFIICSLFTIYFAPKLLGTSIFQFYKHKYKNR